jgi:hypothetical protein
MKAAAKILAPVLACIGLTSVCPFSHPAPASACGFEAPDKPLAFVHVTVIDVSGGPSLPDTTVVVEGGRIVRVGRAPEIDLPKGASIIDGTGRFLIPGLWDMHVHVSHEDVFFPLLLAHGVTGIREMGNDLDLVRSWQKAIGEGRRLGPRMYLAGPIVDGPDIRIPKMRLNAGSPAEARDAVTRVKRLGVDFLKIWSMLNRDVYFEAAAEAGRQGLAFAGHVPLSVTALEASTAGQKSIEHLANVLLGCSKRETALMEERTAVVRPGTPGAPLRFLEEWFYKQSGNLVDGFDPAKAAALFRAFRENGTWICPTLRLWRSYAFIDDPEMNKDPRLRYVPGEWDMQEMWFLKDQTAADLVQVKRVFAKDLEIVGLMRRSGVRFLAGTDSPNIHLFPGFALHDELALLVESGFSPLEALQAATIDPARFMGTLDSMGTVEAGKIADLVLCDADPTADIHNLARIRAVVANGRLIDDKGLKALLDEASRKAGK